MSNNINFSKSVFMDSNCADKCIQPCSVVGVPSAEDWPQEVALPQSAFSPRPPKPIENLVPDMDEQGRTLLLVLNSKQIQIYDVFFKHTKTLTVQTWIY